VATQPTAVPGPDIAVFDSRPLPESVRAAVDEFDVDELVELVLERCASEVFGPFAHDEEFRARLRASIRQNTYALRDVLAGRSALADVVLDRLLELATVQAQMRVPQQTWQRSYRISYFLQWEMWTRHIRAAAEERGLSAEETADALSQLTRVALSYQDHVATKVAEGFAREQEALNRSRTHVRRSLVRDVLAGKAGELTASDMAILAYPLEAHHVAVLLPTVPEGAALQLADGLRAATRCYQQLVHPLTLSSSVVWLGRLEPWRLEALEAIRNVLTSVGVDASVSAAASGVGGFCDTLTQAQETERVRAAWGPTSAPAVITYGDAALEILLLQNDDLANRFVDTELGPLALDTTEAARLRETLEASFRFGSHVAAAEHLQLHEHTVRNRLHKAEELLGHSLQERRIELQVAVRLVRLLGRDKPQPTAAAQPKKGAAGGSAPGRTPAVTPLRARR
jgi:DNA-binding PucR family transcriptional regulator